MRERSDAFAAASRSRSGAAGSDWPPNLPGGAGAGNGSPRTRVQAPERAGDATIPDWRGLLAARERWSPLLHVDVVLEEAAPRLRGRLVLLAAPYSSRAVDDDGRWSPLRSLECSVRASRWAERFARLDVTAIAPVVAMAEMFHTGSHDPATGSPDPLDAALWRRWCRPLTRVADAVVVPPLPGWEDSAGVWRAVIEALTANRPVWLLREGG